MTALLIIGGILLLLVVLACCTVGICVTFENGRASVLIHYLFLKIPIDPSKDKQPKGQAKSVPKKKKSIFEKIKDQKGILDAVSYVLEQVKAVIDPMIKLFHKIVISPMICKVTVGGDDAAQTAITCGAIDAALYPFAGWLSSLVTIEHPDIAVIPCYDGEYDLYFFMKAKVRPISIIGTVMQILIQYLSINIKKEGA